MAWRRQGGKGMLFWVAAMLWGAAAAGNTPPTARPTVMILVDEQALGAGLTAETETAAAGRLAQAGFPVVDRDVARARLSAQREALRQAGDIEGAAALGLEMGAELILVGEATAKPSVRSLTEGRLRSYDAAVTLRMVRARDGLHLASGSGEASAVGLDDVTGSSRSLRLAADRALDALLPRLEQALNPSAEPAAKTAERLFSLTVSGLDETWKLRAVRERLRNMPGAVDQVVQRIYSQGEAVFSFKSSLSAEDLAGYLIARPPKGLTWQARNMAAGRLTLEVAEAAGRGGSP